jgi:tetratricopeptide (TPR) repeat protein
MPLRRAARPPVPRFMRSALQATVCALLVALPPWAQAAEPKSTSPRIDQKPAPLNSGLDAELFYQLFVGELSFARGEPGTAYQVMLEAARRTKEEALFRRTVEIAARAGAGEEALSAAKAWRQALPKSLGAAQTQSELLLALNKGNEAVEPLKALIELVPAADRKAALSSLPRFVPLGGNAERSAAAANAIDKVLEPWLINPDTRSTALLASARSRTLAGETARALPLLRDTLQAEPANEGAAFLAVELMERDPQAEALVRQYLGQPTATHAVRLGYARRLTGAQRFPEALAQTEQVTQSATAPLAAWLMQGALLIELGRPAQAQSALQRYLTARNAQPPKATETPTAQEDGDDSASPSSTEDKDLSQAYLMLAQAAEQQKDYMGAQAWLDKLGETADGGQALQRRASLLARQGKLKQARELLQKMPEGTNDELRAKALADAQLLREAQQWKEAEAVLAKASQRLPDDIDLLYEHAMVEEKLGHLDNMERLLRQVIQLKPDYHHAYNALGYSLADRNVRLDEARQLVARALELAPGDPFITDSLGWIEFRLGRKDIAAQLLRQAYAHRPDTEIAAHLGEVLWSLGEREEARQVLRSGRERDSSNEVLQDTLRRLKVDL